MINKNNLLVVGFASDEESRYSLGDVRFTPQETMATNGHYLVRVSNVPSETIQTNDRCFSISAKALKPIKVKNGDAIELVSNGTGSTWNLTTGVSTYHLEETGNTFPNVDMIMPKDAPAISIGLNPEYLAKLGKAFAEFQRDTRQPVVKVSVWTADKPIQIEATNESGQTMRALLMPVRLS